MRLFCRCPEHHSCRGMSRRMQVFDATKLAVFGREIKEIPCIAVSVRVPFWRCGGMLLPSWGSTKYSLQKRPNYGQCISFVGLKQLITGMRVLHVGCSIPARTFGRTEFSQNSNVCSQLAVWNLLWSQSLGCKLSKCKIFRDWLFNCAIIWRTSCWWRTRNVLEGGSRRTCSSDGRNACSGEKMVGIHVTLVAQSMWKDSTVEPGY